MKTVRVFISQVEQKLRDMKVEALLPMLCAIGTSSFERERRVSPLRRRAGLLARQKAHGVRVKQVVEKTFLQCQVVKACENFVFTAGSHEVIQHPVNLVFGY